MQKQLSKKIDESLHLDNNYVKFLKEIKNRLKNTQIRAALAANAELIKFYWQLGSDLIKYQKSYQWGEHFLEQFSHDMRQAFSRDAGVFQKESRIYASFCFSLPDIRLCETACFAITLGAYCSPHANGKG